MQGSRKASPSVTAAAVVAIIGSMLVACGGALAALGLFMAPPSPQIAAISPAVKTLTECLMGFVVALGIFGMVTGVGLLRLKNWARIATLIWSGLAVFFCALTLAFVAIAPFPTPPNAPVNALEFVKAAVFIFYGLPLAIGVWWLILFNRKGVTAQFARSTPATVDASGFPAELGSGLVPACPLPLMVLGGFLLFSTLSIFFVFFFPFPAVVFGHALRGAAGTIVFMTACLACGAAGIGLLRLKEFGFWLALGLQAFWLLSGIVTVSSPNYFPLMRELMTEMQARLGGPYSEYPLEHLQLYAYAGLMAPVLIGAILLFYRARFLEACAARRPGARRNIL